MKIEVGKKYNMRVPNSSAAYALVVGKESDFGLEKSEIDNLDGSVTPLFYGIVVYSHSDIGLYRTSLITTWCEDGYERSMGSESKNDLISEINNEV